MVCSEAEPYIKFTEQNKVTSTSLGTNRGVTLDWLFVTHIDQDLRMGYIEPDCSSPQKVKHSVEFSMCRIFQISPISNRPVCYSTESLKYTQTAVYFTIIITQIGNSKAWARKKLSDLLGIAQKTRRLSVSFQGLRNYFMIFGWFSMFLILYTLAYVTPLNTILGTRDVILQHCLIPGVPFSMMIVLMDEVRKYLIRNTKSSDPSKPNWFERNCMY